MTRKSLISALASGAGVIALAALGTSRAQVAETHAMKGPATITKAVAVLHATSKGGEAAGKVVFTQTPQGVRVEAHITGLTPGAHGFHIHEFGDSSSPDGKAAGGHFNPLGAPHGKPASPQRHIGDLGNIEADAKGHAKVDLVDPALKFFGPTSIIGRGVVVHAKPDDFGQPVGNAGDRVAVGAIGIASSAPAAAPPALGTPATK